MSKLTGFFGYTLCDEKSTSQRQVCNPVLRLIQPSPLTITSAMALISIASPATIHRKLDDLREAGLIEQTFEGNNRRTKYLSPTSLADSYFSSVGEVMQEALLAS